ncbi:DUF2939 domain-containing protein [Acinetobacter silvestris]|uniref:DUF2939 domain-containing protein n=1 Tax=Acinetobacter silvestris TaxID=1977882 RepID=A0A1Y3CDS2_9GAMM|nr:DUF2939 domain-containing protein [Acinetobacter silvestris]OTG64800.1 hypothetical protein B9T28_11380 [Acinetobacter silvestris]
MNKVKIGFSLCILVCIALFFASPYWMLYQINQAIEQNQAGEISEYIDFPSVRASLKPQVNMLLRQKLGIEHPDHPLEVYATQLTDHFSEQVVDVAVTSQSIVLLMQGKQLKESIKLPKFDRYNKVYNLLFNPTHSQKMIANETTATEPLNTKNQVDQPQYQAHYLSLNTFEVIVPTTNVQQTRFIFQRHFLQWKLTKIDLGY